MKAQPKDNRKFSEIDKRMYNLLKNNISSL